MKNISKKIFISLISLFCVFTLLFFAQNSLVFKTPNAVSAQTSAVNQSVEKNVNLDEITEFWQSAELNNSMSTYSQVPAGWNAISTPQDLSRLTTGKKYYLTNDIDLSGKLWDPVNLGNSVFDGRGYSIIGMTIDDRVSGSGLFSYATGVITNLSLKNIYIKKSSTFAVLASGTAQINNVIVESGVFDCSETYLFPSTATIKDCVSLVQTKDYPIVPATSNIAGTGNIAINVETYGLDASGDPVAMTVDTAKGTIDVSSGFNKITDNIYTILRNQSSKLKILPDADSMSYVKKIELNYLPSQGISESEGSPYLALDQKIVKEFETPTPENCSIPVVISFATVTDAENLIIENIRQGNVELKIYYDFAYIGIENYAFLNCLETTSLGSGMDFASQSYRNFGFSFKYDIDCTDYFKETFDRLIPQLSKLRYDIPLEVYLSDWVNKSSPEYIADTFSLIEGDSSFWDNFYSKAKIDNTAVNRVDITKLSENKVTICVHKPEDAQYGKTLYIPVTTQAFVQLLESGNTSDANIRLRNGLNFIDGLNHASSTSRTVLLERNRSAIVRDNLVTGINIKTALDKIYNRVTGVRLSGFSKNETMGSEKLVIDMIGSNTCYFETTNGSAQYPSLYHFTSSLYSQMEFVKYRLEMEVEDPNNLIGSAIQQFKLQYTINNGDAIDITTVRTNEKGNKIFEIENVIFDDIVSLYAVKNEGGVGDLNSISIGILPVIENASSFTSENAQFLPNGKGMAVKIVGMIPGENNDVIKAKLSILTSSPTTFRIYATSSDGKILYPTTGLGLNEYTEKMLHRKSITGGFEYTLSSNDDVLSIQYQKNQSLEVEFDYTHGLFYQNSAVAGVYISDVAPDSNNYLNHAAGLPRVEGDLSISTYKFTPFGIAFKVRSDIDVKNIFIVVDEAKKDWDNYLVDVDGNILNDSLIQNDKLTLSTTSVDMTGNVKGKTAKNVSVFDEFYSTLDLRLYDGSGKLANPKYRLKKVEVYYDGSFVADSTAMGIKLQTVTTTKDVYKTTFGLNISQFSQYRSLKTNAKFEVKYVLEVIDYDLSFTRLGDISDVSISYGSEVKSLVDTVILSVPYGTEIKFLSKLPTSQPQDDELYVYSGQYGRLPISTDEAGRKVVDGQTLTVIGDNSFFVVTADIVPVNFYYAVEVFDINNDGNVDNYDIYTGDIGAGQKIDGTNIVNINGKYYKRVANNFAGNIQYGKISEVGNLYNSKKEMAVGGSVYLGYQFVPVGYTFHSFYATDSAVSQSYDELGDTYCQYVVGENAVDYYVLFTPQSYQITFDNNITGKLSIEKEFVHEVYGPVTFHRGAKQKLNQNTFIREGYIFKGWSTTVDNGTVDFKDKQEILNISETNVTLYAVWNIIEFEVRLINDGNIVDTSTRTYWQTFGNIPAQFKVGYNFSGWHYNQGDVSGTGTKNYIPITIPSEIIRAKHRTKTENTNEYLIKLYAIFAPKQYSIIYNINDDGRDVTVTQTLTYGQEFIFHNTQSIQAENALFKKIGYKIAKWERVDSKYPFWYNPDEKIADSSRIIRDENVSSLALNARWEKDSFDINIYAVSNSATNVDEYKKNYTGVTFRKYYYYSSDTKKIVLDETTKIYIKIENGYAFDGVYLDSELTQPVSLTRVDDEFTSQSMPATGLSYYFKFSLIKYTIQYNLYDRNDGNPITEISPQFYYCSNSRIDLPTDDDLPQNFKRAGFMLNGWQAVYEGVEELQVWTYIPSYQIGDLFFVANFIPRDDTAYKVEHYQENANDDGYTLYETENKVGTTNQLTTAEKKNYDHFWFYGKITQESIAGDGSTVIKIYYDRELCYIYLNKNLTEYQTILSGKYLQTINLPLVSTFFGFDRQAEGLTFAGWANEEHKNSNIVDYADGAEYTFGANTNIDNYRNEKIYAVWQASPSYTIEFNSNGADGEMADINAKIGQSVTLTSLAYSNTGYTFLYWKNAKNNDTFTDGQTVLNIGESGETVTLVAQWKMNDFTDLSALNIEKTYDGNPAQLTLLLNKFYESSIHNYEVRYALTSENPTFETALSDATIYNKISSSYGATFLYYNLSLKDVADSGNYTVFLRVYETKYNQSKIYSAKFNLSIAKKYLTITLQDKVFDNTRNYLQEMEVTGLTNPETVYIASTYTSVNVGTTLSTTASNFEVYLDSEKTTLATNFYVLLVYGSSSITKRTLALELNENLGYSDLAQTIAGSRIVDGFEITYVLTVKPALAIGIYEKTQDVGFDASVITSTMYGSGTIDKNNFEIYTYGRIAIGQKSSSEFDFGNISVSAKSLIYDGRNKITDALNINLDGKTFRNVSIKFYNSHERKTEVTEIIDAGTYYASVIFDFEGYNLSDRPFDCNVTIQPREIVLSAVTTFDKTFDNSTDFVCSEETVSVANVNDIAGYTFESLNLSASYEGHNASTSAALKFVCGSTNYKIKTDTFAVKILKAKITVELTKNYTKVFDRQFVTLKHLQDFRVIGKTYGTFNSDASITFEIVNAGTYSLTKSGINEIKTNFSPNFISTDINNYEIEFSTANNITVIKSGIIVYSIDKLMIYNGVSQGLSLQLQGSAHNGSDIWIRNDSNYSVYAQFGEGDYAITYSGVGYAESQDAPVNAGNYTWKLTTDNFVILSTSINGSSQTGLSLSELEIDFTIEKRNINSINAGEDSVYHSLSNARKTKNNNEMNVVGLANNHTLSMTYETTANAVDTTYLFKAGQNLSLENSKYIDNNSYSIADRNLKVVELQMFDANGLNVTSNYNAPSTDDIYARINIIPIYIDGLSVIADEEIMYDGKNHSLDTTDFDSAITSYNSQFSAGLIITKTYQQKIGTEYVDTLSVCDAGDYRLKLTSNLKISNLQQYAYLIITQREITLYAKQNLDKQFDNTNTFPAEKLNADFIGVNGAEDVLGFTFEALQISLIYKNIFVVENNNLIASISNSNYKLTDSTLAGKITKRAVTVNLGDRTKVYNKLATEIELSNAMAPALVSGHTLSGKVIFETTNASDTVYTLNNSNLDLTNASLGLYSSNYSLTYIGTLKIDRAVIDLTISAQELAKTYNGKPQAVAYTAICDSCNLSDDYAVTYDNSSITPINAGTYKFKLTATSENFNVRLNSSTAEMTNFVEVDYVISPKIIETFDIGELSVDFYNPTKTQIYTNLTNSVIMEDDVLTYRFTVVSPVERIYLLSVNADNASITKEILSFVNADSANVLSNYNFSTTTFTGSITVEASAIPDTVDMPENVTVTYNGQSHSLQAQFSALITYLESQSKTYTLTDVPRTDVGVYESSLSIDGTSTVISASLTIRPKEITLAVAEGKNLDKAYDNTDVFPITKLNETYIVVATEMSAVTGFTYASLGLSAVYELSYVSSNNRVIVSHSNRNYKLQSSSLAGQITPKEIAVNLGEIEVTYTGSTHNINLVNSMTQAGDLYNSDTLAGYVTCTNMDAGTYSLSTDNLITTNANVGDASDNYTLTFSGQLKIKPVEIQLTYSQADFHKTYNAQNQGAEIAMEENALFSVANYTVTYDGESTLPISYKDGGYEWKIEMINNNFIFKANGGENASIITQTFHIDKLAVTTASIGTQNEVYLAENYKNIILGDESVTSLASRSHKLHLTVTVNLLEPNTYILPNTNVEISNISVKNSESEDVSQNYDLSNISFSGSINLFATKLPQDIDLVDEAVTFDATAKTLSSISAVKTRLDALGLTYYAYGSYRLNDGLSAEIRSAVAPTFTDSGEYIIKMYINAGALYPEYLEAKLTINKRSIYISKLDATQKITKEYDGTTALTLQNLSNLVIKTYNASNEFVSLSSVVADSGLKLVGEYTASNAGNCVAKVRVVDAIEGSSKITNYTFIELSESATITAKVLTLSAKAVMPDFYYKNSPYETLLTNFDISGLVSGHTIVSGTVRFTQIENAKTNSYVLSAETKHSLNEFSIEDAEHNQVEPKNYQLTFGGEVYVKKAQLKLINYKLDGADAPDSITYDGQTHIANASLEILNNRGALTAIDQSLVVTLPYLDNLGNAQIIASEIKNSGRYIVTFALNETMQSNYEIVEGETLTIDINKLDVTIDLNSTSINQSMFTKELGETDPAMMFNFYVESTKEEISDITLKRVAGETKGKYDVSLADTFDCNNYNILLANSENKFEIKSISSVLNVTILSSESNISKLRKVFDNSPIPELNLLNLEYTCSVAGENVTDPSLRFDSLKFINGMSVNAGTYTIDSANSQVTSSDYENVRIIACPTYEIMPREILFESTSWDKEYDSNNIVDLTSLKVYDAPEGVKGAEITPLSTYYPVFEAYYDNFNSGTQAITISTNANYKVIGTYTGVISRRNVVIAPNANSQSAYGDIINIEFDCYENGELDNTYKQNIINSGLKFELLSSGNPALLSTSQSIVAGLYDITLENSTLKNFQLTIETSTYRVNTVELEVEGTISKDYDLTSQVSLTELTLVGVKAQDVVILESAEFDSATVGENKIVTFTLSGDDSANYTVRNSVGKITNRKVTIEFDYNDEGLINRDKLENKTSTQIILNYGQNFSDVTLPSPTHEGYTLLGWQLNTDTENEILLDSDFEVASPYWNLDESTKTATAIWQLRNFSITVSPLNESDSLTGGTVTFIGLESYAYNTSIDLLAKTNGEDFDYFTFNISEGFEFDCFRDESSVQVTEFILTKDIQIYYDLNQYKSILILNAVEGYWSFDTTLKQTLVDDGWTIYEKRMQKQFLYTENVDLGAFIPLRTGYNFTGFDKTDYDLVRQWKRSQDLTLNALYSVKSYNLTLKTETGYFDNTVVDESVWSVTRNGENIISITKTVNYDSVLGEIIEPLYKGFTFDYWISEQTYATNELAEAYWKFTENKTFTAVFEENTYEVTVGAEDDKHTYSIYVYSQGGELISQYKNADSSALTIEVKATNKIVITAGAFDGYTFEQWKVLDKDLAVMSGGYLTDANTLTISSMVDITQNITIIAEKTNNSNNIIISINEKTYGTVGAEDKITSAETSSITVSKATDSTLEITATAFEGYEFVGWTIRSGNAEISPTENSSIITLSKFSADVSIEAEFKKARLTITVLTETDKGQIIVDNNSPITSFEFKVFTGESIEFDVVESHGYFFKDLKFETTGENLGKFNIEGLKVKFTDFTTSGTLTVIFSKMTYTLSTNTLISTDGVLSSSDIGGSVSVYLDEETHLTTFEYQTRLRLVANANNGYHFVCWSNSDFDFNDTFYNAQNLAIDNNEMSFNIAGNETVYAIFELNSYEVFFDTNSKGGFNGSILSFSETIKHGDALLLENIKLVPYSGYVFEKWVRVDENGNESDITFVGENNNELIIVSEEHFRAIFNLKNLYINVTAQIVAEDNFTNSLPPQSFLSAITVVENEHYVGFEDATYESGAILTPLKVTSKATLTASLELNTPYGYEFDNLSIVGSANYIYDSGIITLSNYSEDFSVCVSYRAKEYTFEVEFVDEDNQPLNAGGYVALTLSQEGSITTIKDEKIVVTVKHLGAPKFNAYSLKGYYFTESEYLTENILELNDAELTEEIQNRYSYGKYFAPVLDFDNIDSENIAKLTITIARVVFEITFVENYPMNTSAPSQTYTAKIKFGESKLYDFAENYTNIVSPSEKPSLRPTHAFAGYAEKATGFGQNYFFDENGIYHIYENKKIYGWFGISDAMLTNEHTQSSTLYAMWRIITHNLSIYANPQNAVEGSIALFNKFENIRIESDGIIVKEGALVSLNKPQTKDGYLYIGYKAYKTQNLEVIVQGTEETFSFLMPDCPVTIEYYFNVAVIVEAEGEGEISVDSTTNYTNSFNQIYETFDLNEKTLTIRAKAKAGYEVAGFEINGIIITENTESYEISYSTNNATATLVVKKLLEKIQIKAIFQGRLIEVKVYKHTNGFIKEINEEEITYTGNSAILNYRVGTSLDLLLDEDYGYEYKGLEKYGQITSFTLSSADVNGVELKPLFEKINILFNFVIMENSSSNKNAGQFISPYGIATSSYVFGSVFDVKWKANERYEFTSRVTINNIPVQSSNNQITIDTANQPLLALSGNNIIRVYFKKILWIEKGEELVKNGTPFSGSGTENNPYIISTGDQISALAYLVNIAQDEHYTVAYYKLAIPIQLAERFWKPIGVNANPFNGTFIFGSFTVKEIHLDKEYYPTRYEGLFGVCGLNAEFVIEELNKTLVYIVLGSILGAVLLFAITYLIVRAVKKNKYNKISGTMIK